ncbi:MAG: glycosyltransferase family 39 protein [Bacteroidales bacterium]|jgi:hypothetical protein|nr:glycosyltransferase family 39 protein [Bacteroidales bacterium]
MVQLKVKKNLQWKPYLLFAIFAFILYSNTLHHYFALDDGIVMIDNAFTQQGIKGIPNILKYDPFVGNIINNNHQKCAEQVKEELKMVAGGRYRPLSLITFALEVQFFGKEYTYPNSHYTFKGNPFVSHLNNILLYLFTTCLLFLILQRIFPPEKEKKWYLSFPFLSCILFLAHPIHTEVVANIKGRDEIMTLLGSLAALWFTIKYFDSKRTYNLLWSGLCLFLALLSKENAITFLAVIPITIYYFIERKTGEIIKSIFPLLIASILFMLIRMNVLGNANSSTIVPDLLNNPFMNATKGETVATIFFTLILYVKLLFFPHPLTFDYYPFHIEIVNWTNWVAIFSLLFYLGITFYAFYGLIKKRDIFSYSIWFYLLPLSLVSNLFFPIGTFMGERFVFISSIGFCIFAGWLIYNYFHKFTKNIKHSNRTIIFTMFFILCFFSVKTINRNKAWKDSFTLYETDVKISENSAKSNYLVGHVLLRKAIFPDNEKERNKKEYYCDEAARYLKRAIKIYPDHTDALIQLGNLYFDCYKDVAKSLHYFARAFSSTSTRTDEIYNYTVIELEQINGLLSENRINSTPIEIIQSCDEMLKIIPDFGELFYIKGLLYGKYLNNLELSLINFEKADSLYFPKTAIFYEDIGVAYAVSKNYKKALSYLLKAVESGSTEPVIFINIGIVYEQLGDKNNANIYYRKGNEIKNRKQ